VGPPPCIVYEGWGKLDGTLLWASHVHGCPWIKGP
jgi:hypothetical protein